MSSSIPHRHRPPVDEATRAEAVRLYASGLTADARARARRAARERRLGPHWLPNFTFEGAAHL